MRDTFLLYKWSYNCLSLSWQADADDDLCKFPEIPVAVGGKPAIPPTITVTDADKVESSDSAKPDPEQLETQTPGAMPQGIVSTIPDWYKAGWRAVGGIDEPRPEGEEKDKAILDLFISDMYYGDWYHNAAIIFFVRTINLAFVTRLRIFQIIGCICVSLSHPISGGMGVVSCGPCDLFDVLHYVSSPCQTTRPRRYSTRTCEESSDV